MRGSRSLYPIGQDANVVGAGLAPALIQGDRKGHDPLKDLCAERMFFEGKNVSLYYKSTEKGERLWQDRLEKLPCFTGKTRNIS